MMARLAKDTGTTREVRFACAAGLSGLLGCGSSSRLADAGTGDDVDAAPLGPGAEACTSTAPPTPPQAPTHGDLVPHTYAVRRLLLGDTDRMGDPSSTAWESYG